MGTMKGTMINRMGFLLVAVLLAVPSLARAQQKPKPAPAAPAAAAGPVIVLETAKGTIEIQTYPQEAPKTVAYIIGLIKKNFYNGQRFHRVESGFVIQIGDPQTRDMTKQASWGTGNSGTPVGVAEISKKLLHTAGAVGMAHGGDAKSASGQFYITLRSAPTLNGKYAVFGKVIKGLDVAAKIQKADVLKRAFVRE
jgi:peptidyl-prolyl cis-trans isomerase B (cyclophilin B)